MSAPTIDEFGGMLRDSATAEVRHIMKMLSPADMTPLEILGVLAILRPAMARYEAPTAATLKLVTR